jgi:undecaprenyl-diphosphatase
METLSRLDDKLFLYLNSLHVSWMDRVMTLITDMWVWMPLYLLLIYWIVKSYGRRWWWIILAVIVVVFCSDQLSSHVCKPIFQRLRPCHNAAFQDLIHLPKGKAGGQYGFVSSHAANTFSIAVFLIMALRKFRPWPAILLILWAVLSSYSRIYIGYHYPGDIFCGTLLGILVGLILWKVFQNVILKKALLSEQGS